MHLDSLKECLQLKTMGASEYVIRSYEDHDLPGVLHVENECFEPGDRYPRRVFEYYSRKGAIFKVALYQGVIVGYVIASVENNLCHVVSLAVKRDYRRRGIGIKLTCEALAECVKRGARAAYLEVEVVNEPAINLYKKLGFRIVGEVVNYYGPGRSAYIMWKEL
ncbi:MAG: N-acetyltransferase [Desulfurococcaceae archaeon]